MPEYVNQNIAFVDGALSKELPSKDKGSEQNVTDQTLNVVEEFVHRLEQSPKSDNADLINRLSPEHVYECSHCGETYNIKHDLVNHLLSNHSDERNQKVQEVVSNNEDAKQSLNNSMNQNDRKSLEVIFKKIMFSLPTRKKII